MAGSTEVVVIGAGPAGLAIGACLRKQGLDFIILERNQQVGSSWHGHFERLHLHTVKQLSALPYIPFPAAYPLYVPRNLMIDYLQGYAATFDLKPRFGETAKSVRRTGSEWFIEATSSSIVADHVVIASGLNTVPVVPSIPGIEKFTGRVIHSAAYANAKPFAGQSVLVIGMGNTGSEIALDLCNGGARTTISLRNGVHVTPRDLFGIPIQIVAMLATRILPMKANDALFPLILDMVLGHPARYGVSDRKKAFCGRLPSPGEFQCSMLVRFERSLKALSRSFREYLRPPRTVSCSMAGAKANSTLSSSPLDFVPIIKRSSKPRTSTLPITSNRATTKRVQRFILLDSRVPYPDCFGKSRGTPFVSPTILFAAATNELVAAWLDEQFS